MDVKLDDSIEHSRCALKVLVVEMVWGSKQRHNRQTAEESFEDLISRKSVYPLGRRSGSFAL
jgi:hypothetical protein